MSRSSVSRPSFVPASAGGDSGIRGRIHPAPVGITRPGLNGARTWSPRKEDPVEGLNFFGGAFHLRATPEGRTARASGRLPSGDRRKILELSFQVSSAWPRCWQLPVTWSLAETPRATSSPWMRRRARRSGAFKPGRVTAVRPSAYAVNGRQYIATPSGWGSAVGGLFPQLWPESEDFRAGSTLFVFALLEGGGMIWLSLLLLPVGRRSRKCCTGERLSLLKAAPLAIVTGLPGLPGVDPDSEAGVLTAIMSPRPFATASRNRPWRAGRISSLNRTFQQ